MRPMTPTLGTPVSTGDHGTPDSVSHGRWSSVATEAAKRLGPSVKPATINAWLHSTSVATMPEKLAIILAVCGELGAVQLAAKIMAPIREAETKAPSLPLRELLHHVREGFALTEVTAARHVEQPTAGSGKALKAALAWTAHAALEAQKVTQC